MTGHQDNAHVNRIMHDLGLSSESIATRLLNRQIGHGSQQQAQEMVASSEEEGADQTDTLSAFGDDEILMTELLDEVPPFDLINQGIVDTIHLEIMARHGVLGGNIRAVDVRVVDEHGNIIYTPPPAAHVPQLLEQFIQDMNSAIGQASTGLIEARVVAAWAYYQLVAIHPYRNGNGRTARVLMSAILRRFHLPPLVLEPDARRNYDAYLQEANGTCPLS